MFRDDVSMDSFIKTIAGQTDEPGLDAHDGKTDAFFNWRFAPVEIRTILIQEIVLQPVLIRKKTYSTKIGNTK